MDTSCKNWEERLKLGKSLIPDLNLPNQELAEKALETFNYLKIPDVLGQPQLKTACGDWFKDIVKVVFGSLEPATKQRLIKELFVLVPKKNSKTTYSAALMLVSVLFSKRPNAEFLLVAPTKDVANLAFSQASGMIRADRKLNALFKIQDHLKTLTFNRNGCKLLIKSFSADVMTGVKPAGVLVDELHVISMRSDAENIMRQIRGGMLSQPEAFLLIITTQSAQPPRGVFKDLLERARLVRDGIKESGGLLPILYEFPKEIQNARKVIGQEEKWRNPELWSLVLPNLGKSIHLDLLLQDFNGIKDNQESLTIWASQHLNIQIGQVLRADRWTGADFWEKQGTDCSLNEILETSDVIVAGIDGGGLDDLLSLAILGRNRDSQHWIAWSKSWVFDGVLELRKREASHLKDFQSQGDLVIINEPGQDIEQLADLLETIEKTLPFSLIGMDPMGVGSIIDALAIRGINSDRIVGISQGWKMCGAIKTTERKLVDGTLFHVKQPILDWAVSNAKIEPRGNAILITKQAAGYLKIDPLMALFNAVSLMSTSPTPIKKCGGIEDFLKIGILST